MYLLFLTKFFVDESTDDEAEVQVEKFWHWNSFSTYLKYLSALFLMLFFTTMTLSTFKPFVVMLGFISAGVEVSLPYKSTIIPFL